MQITETARVIKEACQMLNDNGFSHSPQIVAQKDFDLTEFTEQESDIDGLETEFVNQGGGGITGDSFEGTMAWSIGGGWLFVCDYSS